VSEEDNPAVMPNDETPEKPAAKPLLDTPVAVDSRIDSVDVLRGFALLGILVINIAMFGLPQVALKNPAAVSADTGLNLVIWTASYVVFFQKFMAIFSMLFGAGLVLMYERAEAAGRAFGKTYYRRLGWLLLIGILHAYFLWWGDILYHYALTGMILYPFRRMSGKRLIILGAIVFFVGAVLFFGLGIFFDFCRTTAIEAEAAKEAGETLTSLQESMSEVWKEVERGVNVPPEVVDKEIEAYRGGYWSVISRSAPAVLSMHTFVFIFFIVWRIAGLMLIGMGLMKLGVFAAHLSRRAYIKGMIFGYGLGLPLFAYLAYKFISSDFDNMNIFGLNAIYEHFGILLIAGGHISLIMLICQSEALNGIRRRLAAVGRMALSNYLMHSLIFAPIFYGYGLGLFGHVKHLGLMGFVLGMWILQLYLSPLWLKHFQFGPAEWLWRSLTYKKKQPMRLT
jgi:uncharacterized protein